MKEHIFTDPDTGKKHVITGDGTREEAFEALQEVLASQQPQQPQQPQEPSYLDQAWDAVQDIGGGMAASAGTSAAREIMSWGGIPGDIREAGKRGRDAQEEYLSKPYEYKPESPRGGVGHQVRKAFMEGLDKVNRTVGPYIPSAQIPDWMPTGRESVESLEGGLERLTGAGLYEPREGETGDQIGVHAGQLFPYLLGTGKFKGAGDIANYGLRTAGRALGWGGVAEGAGQLAENAYGNKEAGDAARTAVKIGVGLKQAMRPRPYNAVPSEQLKAGAQKHYQTMKNITVNKHQYHRLDQLVRAQLKRSGYKENLGAHDKVTEWLTKHLQKSGPQQTKVKMQGLDKKIPSRTTYEEITLENLDEMRYSLNKLYSNPKLVPKAEAIEEALDKFVEYAYKNRGGAAFTQVKDAWYKFKKQQMLERMKDSIETIMAQNKGRHAYIQKAVQKEFAKLNAKISKDTRAGKMFRAYFEDEQIKTIKSIARGEKAYSVMEHPVNQYGTRTFALYQGIKHGGWNWGWLGLHEINNMLSGGISFMKNRAALRQLDDFMAQTALGPTQGKFGKAMTYTNKFIKPALIGRASEGEFPDKDTFSPLNPF